MDAKIITCLCFLLTLSACDPEPTKNKTPVDHLSNPKKKEVSNSKTYYQSDSVKIIRFSRIRKGQHVALIFNERSNFENYFQDLEKAFWEAASEGIELDSIKTISMDFFSYFEEMVDDFSAIDGVQKEMVQQEKEDRQFLNHQLIGEQLKKSKSIHQVIHLLGRDYTSIKNILVGKCRSASLSENSRKEEEYRLHCAHLMVYLK